MKRVPHTKRRYLDRRQARALCRRKRRQHRKIKRYRRYIAAKEAFARSYGPESQILKMLAKHADRRLVVKTGIHVTVPATFSVIEDPALVIDTINQFAAVKSSGARPSRVYLDQADMQHYDLAASALLDLVAVELRNELAVLGRPGRFEGRFPRTGPVARFIKAIGIVKHLGIRDHMPSSSERQRYRVFDSRNRHYRPLRSAKLETPKERAASRFVDHMNDCLSTQSKQLTRSGVTRLSGCLGELLDNAEEHGGFPDWSLLGYLDLDRQQPILEIAIFNFGHSIAESFLNLPDDHFAWTALRPYVERHNGSKRWGKRREEDLITVSALQPHVSSKNVDETTNRGHGTVQLLNFFARVHQACTGNAEGAKMALVSGSTFIRFDGTHLLDQGSDGNEAIWFNDENSAENQPDSKFVRDLGSTHFPGTIISIRFPLTPSMVQEGASHE